MKNFKMKKHGFLIGLVLLCCILLTLMWCMFYKSETHLSVETTQDSTVPIAMALDDGYLYPTIVSVTSVMENSDKDVQYDFYIMHPSKFKSESKNKLKTLEKKYSKCHINLIDMGDQYKNANDKGHITTPAYYRLSLSDVLPQSFDKVIWLDGDTLTFHDLRKMYDINMDGYYYKGFLDDNVNAVKSFGVNNDHCICSGVMLVNLKELRRDNMVQVFKEFIKKNNEKLIQHDQTTINVVCYEKIGILPAKYGIYSYDDVKQAREQADVYLCSYGYTADELEKAYEDPTILHCIRKPWKSMDVPFADIWWDYARKTDFFEEIHSKYPIF
jgi:lipopolysaccharide biosynthesis glycosyltransferase